jgi:hypothetical protein
MKNGHEFSAMDRKVGHWRRYRRGESADKVADAGFKIIASRYADSLGFLASLIYKWQGNDSGDINRGALKAYDRFVFPLSRPPGRVTTMRQGLPKTPRDGAGLSVRIPVRAGVLFP